MRRVGIVLLIAMLAVFTGNVFAEDTKGSEVNAKGISLDLVTSIPRTMTYQGILKDSLGVPIADTLDITFRIYDDLGNLEWNETIIGVETDEGGYFSVILGEVDDLNLPFDEDYYLELQVEGETQPMEPRQKINMSAYSARTDTSDYAETAGLALAVDDNTVNSASIVDGTIQFGDIGQNGAGTGQVMKWDGIGGAWVADDDLTGGGWVDDGPVVRLETSSDFVGIGTENPNFKLTVGDGNIDQVHPAHDLLVTDPSNARLGVYVNNKGITIDAYGANVGQIYAVEYGGANLDLALNAAGGNVGIGTTSPSRKLDVNGAINATTYYGDGSNLTGIEDGIGGIGTANYIPKFTAPTTLGNSGIYETGDRVGIGTTDPLFNTKLHVASTDQTSGLFTSNMLSGNVWVLHSEYLGAGNYDAVAVAGKSTPANGYGTGGYFEGGNTGLHARVVHSGGSHTFFGVNSECQGSGTAISHGVCGSATGSSDNYGVYGTASGGSFNCGVYGGTHSSTANWGGYFYGNVRITGTLTRGGGGFKIDHPLEPESKCLFHSFVESPDMMNVYNGNVILDTNGEAEVELPEWFETLNSDFRYQLTCIGGFAPVYIAEKIQNNRFKIAGGQPAMEISWQVTGIRHDKFAEANRIQVEVDKPAKERGKYIHAEAYGLGVEYGIGYEEHKRMEEKRFERGEK